MPATPTAAAGDGVIADGVGTIAEWFADPGYVTRATRRLVLYALVPLGSRISTPRKRS